MYDEPVIRRARGPLANVIMGLLHQNPVQRLTAAQMRAQLGSPSERTVVIEPVTTFVTPQPTRDAFDEPKKRRTGLIASAAVAAVAVIALVTFLVVRPNSEPGNAAAQQNAGTTTTTTTTTPPSSTTSSAPSSSSTASPSSQSQSQAPAGTPKSAPQAQQPPPKPKRKTLELARWNDGKWYFTTSPNVSRPPQFSSLDGPAGWLAATQEDGTRPLFACRNKNNTGDHFTSTDENCEGNPKHGLLGYIFTRKPADGEVIPLYRCARDQMGRHFDALDKGCEGATTEFPLGLVLTGP
jgi:eukaryotic-like serine/threonine-protein kinase